MFIVYGWSNRFIESRDIYGSCIKCNSPSLILTGYQKTFNVFWIPVIPIGKSRYIFCSSCNTSFDPEDYTEGSPDKDIRFKTPWWSFTGLIIAAIFFGMGKLFEGATPYNEKIVIQNPHAGTYFIFENHDEIMNEIFYMIGKIEGINGDAYWLRFCGYSYSNLYQAKKLLQKAKERPADFFDENIIEVPKAEFKKIPIVSMTV